MNANVWLLRNKLSHSKYLYYNSRLPVLANSRSQFLLDRLGRCLKLFVSTETISCHEFASPFGLAIFYTRKMPKLSRIPSRPRQCLFEWSSDLPLFAGHGRSIAHDKVGAYMSGDNSDHEGLGRQIEPKWGNATSQNGDNEILYLHGLNMCFRNYYVAYAFV